MSTEEALVAVIIGAIAANLLLAVGLIVGPRWRARRWSDRAPSARSRARAGAVTDAGPRERPVRAGIAADGRPGPLRPVTRRPPITSGAAGGDLLARLEAARHGTVRDAVIDPATGLDVAATWSRWLAEEGARAERYGRPSTIVVVELAGWERLAERLGHDAAERLVPPVAATLRDHARAADRVARLGPARFGALLAETDEVRAINFVERVRSACDVWLAAGAVALRLSIGWAEIGPHRPVDAAVLAADRRLDAERRAGSAAGVGDPAEPDVTAAMLA